MQKRKLLIMGLIALLLIATWPVQAQDSEMTREEMISLVIAAYDNLAAAQYYTFSATQQETQIISSGVGLRRGSLQRETQRTYEDAQVKVGQEGQPDAVSVSITQSDRAFVNGQAQNSVSLSLAMDLILVDGVLYLQVRSISGTLNEAQLALIRDEQERIDTAAAFPTGWVNITESPERLIETMDYLNTAGDSPNFLETLNLDALINLGNTPVLTPEMVVSIVQFPSEVEGEMIFELTLDASQVFANLSVESLFNDEALVGNTNAMLAEMLAGTTITQNVTLITNSEGSVLPLRIATETAINADFTEATTEGNPFNLTQTTETTVDYSTSAIGREFEIVAPDTSVEASSSE